MATNDDSMATPRATLRNRNPPLRNNLFLVKGVHSPDALQAELRLFDDDATVCVETHSLEGIESPVNLRHISEFGPEHGEASSREAGREWVAQLSETVLKSTGKPVWKSFEYKGISAWWFLEIVFQEPSYLVARRKQAIEKASRVLGKKQSQKADPDHEIQLPVVPMCEPVEMHTRLKGWIKNRLKGWIKNRQRRLPKLRFLLTLKRSDVLCLIELENLRRHMDCQDGKVRAVLPYAEGVIEELQVRLGDRCTVLPRRPVAMPIEGWEFLGPALPPLIYEPLPPEFEQALMEVAALAWPVMREYLTLATLREVMVFRLAEYDFYLDLLARVKPKVIFAYNWEGVFRPLTTAARAKGCRVVGVQQALGPYLHGLNHRETGYYSKSNPQGFATPTKVALWGQIHQQEFLTYGYSPESIEITGYARLDKHYQVKDNKQQARILACARLGLDPSRRYLLFTGQSRVLDTIILRAEHFIGAMETLCRLAEEFNFQIIMKPWTSDDMSMVEQAAQANLGLVFVAPQNVIVSNADLLSVSDWLVGTFSSIIGEATLVGNACVLLNYPEARYYFDLPHVEHYRSMIPFVDQPEKLEAVLRPLIESESIRAAAVSRAQSCMHDIFGPCNGQAARKIAQIVLEEIEVSCRV